MFDLSANARQRSSWRGFNALEGCTIASFLGDVNQVESAALYIFFAHSTSLPLTMLLVESDRHLCNWAWWIFLLLLSGIS